MNHGLSSDDIVEDSEPERERIRTTFNVHDRSVSSPFVGRSGDDDRGESEEKEHDLTPIVLSLEGSLSTTAPSAAPNIPILPDFPSSPSPTPPSAQPSSHIRLIPSLIKVVPSLQKSLVPECPFKTEMRKLKECVFCAEDWSEPGKKIKTKWTHLLKCDPLISHSLLIDMVRAQLDSLKSIEKANSVARKCRPLPIQTDNIDSSTSKSTTITDLTETVDSPFFQAKNNVNEKHCNSPPLADQSKRLPSIGFEPSPNNANTVPRQPSPAILEDQLHLPSSPSRTSSDKDVLSVGKEPAEKPSVFSKFAYGRLMDGSSVVTPPNDAPAHKKRKVALFPKRVASKPTIVVPDCPVEGSEVKKLTKCLVCSEDWSKDRKIWKTKWKHIYLCSMRTSQELTVESLKDMITSHIRQVTTSEPKSLLQSLTTKQRLGGRKVPKETTLVPVATEEGRERMKMRIEKVLASSDDGTDGEQDVLDNRTLPSFRVQAEEQEDERGAFENGDDEVEKVPAPTQVFTTSNLGSRFSEYGVSGASGLGLSSRRGRGWFDAAKRGDFLQDSSRSSDMGEIIESSDDERQDKYGKAINREEVSSTRGLSFSPPHSSSSFDANITSTVNTCLPTFLAPSGSRYSIPYPSSTLRAAKTIMLSSPGKYDVVSYAHTVLTSTLRLRGGRGELDGFDGEGDSVVVEDQDHLVELGSSPEIIDLVDSVEEVQSSSPLQVVSILRPPQIEMPSSRTSTLDRFPEGSKSKPASIFISDDNSDNDGICLIDLSDRTPEPSNSNQLDESDAYEGSFFDGEEGVLRMNEFISPGGPVDLYAKPQINMNKDIFSSSPESSSNRLPSPLAPRHFPIKSTKSKGKSRAPVMPDYESWECKKLQNLVKSYGLRQSSSKAQLISLLVDVWKTLNPESLPNPEPSGSSPFTDTSTVYVSKPKAQKKRLSSENQELVMLGSAKGKKMKKVTALMDGSKEDAESELERGKSSCAWSVDVENVDSDLGDEPDQKEKDLIEIFHQMVLQDEELWLRLLRYEPVGFEEMSHLAYKHGARMKGWEIVLKRWMDSQCITYWNLEVTGGRQRAK